MSLCTHAMCVTHHVIHYSIQMYLYALPMYAALTYVYVECLVHVPHMHTVYHTVYALVHTVLQHVRVLHVM